VIPSAFAYEAPTTLDDAVAALATAGDEGKVLAGGQSLIPVLKLRMASPELLVDLGRINELQGVRDDGDALVIGAMTQHHVIANDPLVAEHAALLARAAETVADPQIRHRGTYGGSLVHADPAGDMLAPTLALDATFKIVGPDGTRTVSAAEFFVDMFTTAVGDNEILASIRVPKTTGWGAAYEKFTRVAQQWSIVAVAAAVRVDGGSIAEARVALTNMGLTPIRATAVEQALAGCALDEASVRQATAGAGEGTNPPTDTNGDADFRRHLAGVLTARAVLSAASAVGTP
jgi:carbon-monoxide dehydrogenase medium subunit